MENMESFKIDLNGLQICRMDRLYRNAVEFSLLMGTSFDLKGIRVFKNDIQNEIFIDQPTFSNVNLNKSLNENIIDSVIRFFHSRRDIISFLSGIKSRERFDTFPFFKPKEWNGGLSLPIEYIALSNIQCERRSIPITADIYIGRYFMFPNVPIYDAVQDEYLRINSIKNLEAYRILSFLMERPDVKRKIDQVIEIGHKTDNHESFICKDKKLSGVSLNNNLSVYAPLNFKE